MKESIKKRIEAVRRGEVPEGYRRTRAGIVPLDWQSNLAAKDIFRNHTDKKHNGEFQVLSATQDRGIIPRSEVDIDIKYAEENIGSYKKVEPGDFVISLRSFQGGIEYSEYEGLVSPAYTVLKPTRPISDNYYRAYFKTPDFISRLNGAVYGIRDGKQIGFEDFGELAVHYPPLVEQQKIAEILATCDRVIELKQQLLEEKQRQKRAYLQKMLPQSGCDVPEWRLTGFYLPWQKKKLGELVTFYNGLTYSPDDIRTEGTLVLRSSNVKDGEIVDADNVYVDPTAVNSENVQIGDIIVVVRNGSRALIGKHAEIKADMPNTVIGAFMTGIRSEYPPFVNVLLSTPQFDAEIQKNLGAAINQITGYMFAKMEFMVPEPAERVAIGEFFRAIDNLIALYQRELEQEKQKKKALMQLLLTGLVRVNA